VRKPLTSQRHRTTGAFSAGGSTVRARRLAILLVSACILFAVSVSASPVGVRYQEGALHGFVVLSTLDGNPIAEGDLTQVPQGNRITSHLVFRFKDGSLQEETTIFSQRHYFRLISYHQVQKGPAFPHPTEVTIVPATGQVTVQYTEDDGKEKTDSQRLRLPPELANGILFVLLKNLPANAPSTELPMVVATPKPRLIKLAISSAGKNSFSLAGAAREAQNYVIKIEMGGVTGLVAPLVGKQPPDSHVWLVGGEPPTVVKSEAIAYPGGPIWRVELVAPVWPHAAMADSKSGSPEKH
jgi:hypothetical protein